MARFQALVVRRQDQRLLRIDDARTLLVRVVDHVALKEALHLALAAQVGSDDERVAPGQFPTEGLDPLTALMEVENNPSRFGGEVSQGGQHPAQMFNFDCLGGSLAGTCEQGIDLRCWDLCPGGGLNVARKFF